MDLKMYDKLEQDYMLEKELEEELEDEARDFTDRFDLNLEDAPYNFDIEVVEAFVVKDKLNKLSLFLNKYNFKKESNEVVKLAHSSILDDANELREKLKKEILDLLSDKYSESFTEWNYDTDFKSEVLEFGFNDLEKQFANLMNDGLISLSDLNIDETTEVLWAASGLTPEGHHDFDDNLISLQEYQDRDLNMQSDSPGRDNILEIREEIARKFSEWFEYREPDFESLEDLELEELMNKVSQNIPGIKPLIDNLQEEWEEFLDSVPNDQRWLLIDDETTEEEGEPLVPEEIPSYTDLDAPDYYRDEEPIGTLFDVEELEAKLNNPNYDISNPSDYWYSRE
jgi:hypothetical protein